MSGLRCSGTVLKLRSTNGVGSLPCQGSSTGTARRSAVSTGAPWTTCCQSVTGRLGEGMGQQLLAGPIAPCSEHVHAFGGRASPGAVAPLSRLEGPESGAGCREQVASGVGAHRPG